jgi:uncharacterized protein (TIGR03066 family)
MKRNHWFVLPVLFLLAAFASSAAVADSKPDLKKALVGKWQPAQAKNFVVEFTADLKVHVVMSDPNGSDKKMNIDGSYKWVDASTVEASLTFQKETKTDKMTIAVDGDTLTTTDSNGKVEKFSRVK